MRTNTSIVVRVQPLVEAELFYTEEELYEQKWEEWDKNFENIISEMRRIADDGNEFAIEAVAFSDEYDEAEKWANANVIEAEILDTLEVSNPEEDTMNTNNNNNNADENRMEIRIMKLLNDGVSIRDISQKVNMKIKKVQSIVDTYKLNNPEEDIVENTTTINTNTNTKAESKEAKEESGFFSIIGSFIGATYDAAKSAVAFVMDTANAGLKAAAAGIAALGALLGLDLGVVALTDPTGATAGYIAAITSADALLLGGALTAIVMFAYYAGGSRVNTATVSNQ